MMGRRVVFIVLSILLTLLYVQGINVPAAEASTVYQGDLILTGNNVTTIEGRFDINGSIRVEENATLFLRNAVLNFTQSKHSEFGMTFQNPLNGNPRLVIENTTITSNYILYVNLHGNTSVTGNHLTAPHEIRFHSYDNSFISLLNSSFKTDFSVHDSSLITISNSDFTFFIASDQSNITITNCTINQNLNVYGNSTVNAIDCTIYNVHSQVFSANGSINNLQSNNISYWNLRLNSSMILAPTGWTPNITLLNSIVSRWSFTLKGSSNVTISNSRLAFLLSSNTASTSIYNSSISSWVNLSDSANCHLYNTPIGTVWSNEDATLWLVNSTHHSTNLSDFGKVYVSWYLDVHIVDSLDQDVLSSNVAVSYPNGSLVISESTDSNGLARFQLIEKMENATDEYHIGDYGVEASYESHIEETSINMTDNKQVTIKLEDYTIPEPEDPTEEPSEPSSEEPSDQPSEQPTTEEPTEEPTELPSEEPTENSEDTFEQPTEQPSGEAIGETFALNFTTIAIIAAGGVIGASALGAYWMIRRRK